MFKRLFFSMIFCLIVAVFSIFGQEKEREIPTKVEPQESRPVETPRNDPPPREEPRQVETPRQEPKETPTNNNPSNESSSRDRKRERDNDSEDRRPTKRNNGSEDNNDQPQRPKVIPDDKNKNPVDKPKIPVNPPVQNDNNPKQNEDERRRRNNGGWNRYPYPTSYPPSNSPTKQFSLRDYFDGDDVFFNVYNSYIEPNSANYLPYFDAVLASDYEPLYYVYGREFGINEFPFVADDWTVYYEPDLGDIFVNFNKFGFVSYEKMVWFALGDTYKKVAKKVHYKGQIQRPVLVETLPQLASDRLYSFSVKDLPKGEYEMRFLARDGSTIKHFIRLK